MTTNPSPAEAVGLEPAPAPYTATFWSIAAAATPNATGLGISVQKFQDELAKRGYQVVPLAAQPKAGEPEPVAWDAAFDVEIEKVSTLAMNSNTICREFWRRLRARVVNHPAPAPVDAEPSEIAQWIKLADRLSGEVMDCLTDKDSLPRDADKEEAEWLTKLATEYRLARWSEQSHAWKPVAAPVDAGVVERVRAKIASEERSAGNVQGPSFRGAEWGADIIGAHRQHAADLTALLAAIGQETKGVGAARDHAPTASGEGADPA